MDTHMDVHQCGVVYEFLKLICDRRTDYTDHMGMGVHWNVF
jgi:hypothetical protein